VPSCRSQCAERYCGQLQSYQYQPLPAIAAKWLDVLKQLAPSVRRVAVLHDPGIAANMAFLRTAEAVSGTFGVTVTTAEVRSAEEIERTLIEFAKEPDGGLIVAPAPPTFGNRQMIADNCKPKAITSHENRCFHVLRNRSGSFATFAAIRRASSLGEQLGQMYQAIPMP
jgi:hypothetical protein